MPPGNINTLFLPLFWYAKRPFDFPRDTDPFQHLNKYYLLTQLVTSCLFLYPWEFLRKPDLITSKRRQANINEWKSKSKQWWWKIISKMVEEKLIFKTFCFCLFLCKIQLTGQIESMNTVPIYKIIRPIIALM